MTDAQFIKEINFYQRAINKIIKRGDKRGHCTTDEIQQRYLLESKIDDLATRITLQRLAMFADKTKS